MPISRPRCDLRKFDPNSKILRIASSARECLPRKRLHALLEGKTLTRTMKIVVALCLLASSTAFVPRSLGARPVVRVRADVVEEPATTADDPAKLLE